MGLFDIFRSRRAAAEQVRAAPSGPGIHAAVVGAPDELAAFIRTGESNTASGASVTLDTTMRVAVSWRCVSLIAGAAATLPFDLKRRADGGRREDASDHPLSYVIRRRPNGWQTPSEFRRLMQTNLLLRGNAYALVVRSRGAVRELIPLNPDRVTVSQASDMSLGYQVTLKSGKTLTLPQREVMHLRGLSFDGITGVSLMKYARESIGLSLQSEKSQASSFKHGTKFGVVLKTDKQLGEDGIIRLREGLEAYRGADNAHKSLILEEGMDVTTLGMTAEDSQFIQTRLQNLTEIAMFFGVPPHMLGMTEKTTSWGSGIEQQNIGFITYTLQDWLKTWEEVVARDLIDEPDVYAKFNVSGLLRGDVKTRWEAYVKALQWGVYSPDEVRALEDMNPRDDGLGGRYYDPPNTAGSNSSMKTKPEEGDDAQAADD